MTISFFFGKPFLLYKETSRETIYYALSSFSIKIINNKLKIDSSISFITNKFFETVKSNLSNDYSKKLIIHGLGYKLINRYLTEKTLFYKLGYSHIKALHIATSQIVIKNYKLKRISNKIFILIEGNNYYRICDVAALIKKISKINVYKGTGIRYRGEKIKIKKIKKK